MSRIVSRWAGLAGLVVLSACGGDGTMVHGFTVSGSVSGLDAAGLVLAQGHETVSVSPGATSFTFSPTFVAGAGYRVLVTAQPANQDCSVAGGVGTLGNADVTNIAVTCIDHVFKVGGTVTGLSGAGLSLASGADTLPVPAGASRFGFTSGLTHGTVFDVSVATQPAHQTCSVANGRGTVISADVANIVVTCADRAYTIGGAVNGLTSAGLVLANGSDTLAVSANATTFTLPAKVAVGSSYQVGVLTQPAGLACQVSRGSGTMPGAAVTNLAVDCTSAPFTLGGTIAGLTTAGLVLANGADTLAVAANATVFNLPAPVSFGSSYTLTVQAQPSGLTCSFSNGGNAAPSASTMPSHNVSNAALVCAPQSYALGGTVAGLSSGTVVLANGSDTLPVSGDGSFQMPAPVAYGSTYTVTVLTQPMGLTCTAGNASATMPANNVSDVTVTCAMNTYPVSGTLSALTMTGLVLQNNGTDDTAVAANAAQFTMPTSVAYGSTYNITILSQPTGQICSVLNGSGTVGGPVTNVQIDCPRSVSFTTVGAASWTVPAGITSISVVAFGGGGGGGASSGGNGAQVTATLTVQPGDSINLYVAGGGGNSLEGGDGGGLTYIADSASNFVIAGGGGGGGGGPGRDGAGGDAGRAGGSGISGTGGSPGNGGAGGAAGTTTGGRPPAGQIPGGDFLDILTAGSGSGGAGAGDPGASSGGSGISSAIGNGGAGGFFYGAGGGGGGYGGGGGGGWGRNRGSGGGGGGGSVGPVGATTIGLASPGGPGAGGTFFTRGADGAVSISY